MRLEPNNPRWATKSIYFLSEQTLADTVVLFLIESQKARLVFATFLQN